MYNDFLEVFHRYFPGLKVSGRYNTFPEPEEFFRIGEGGFFATKEEKAEAFLVAALYTARRSPLFLNQALAKAEADYSLAGTTFSTDFVMVFEDYRVSRTPVRILQLVQKLREKTWFSLLAKEQEVREGEVLLNRAIMAAYLTLADYSVQLEKTLLISGEQMGEVLKAIAASVSALSYSTLEQMVYGVFVNNCNAEASRDLRMNSDACLAAYLASNLEKDSTVPVRFEYVPVWRDKTDRLMVAREGTT